VIDRKTALLCAALIALTSPISNEARAPYDACLHASSQSSDHQEWNGDGGDHQADMEAAPIAGNRTVK